jgi:hypothetical protein
MAAQEDPRGMFSRHRLALAPARLDASAGQIERALDAAACDGVDGFHGFVRENGLASLWLQAIQAGRLRTEGAAALLRGLRADYRSDIARYMAQSAALRELDRLFEARSIRYVLMKGGLVRELVYADPALRPASDLDILVAPAQRELTAKALVDAGYAIHLDPTLVSHEATFSRAGVDVDLHWDILRPGRTRLALTAELLGNRRRCDGFWGLDDTHVVFMMLVHPTFAKYVCSPNMALIRVVDFMYWLRKRRVDWAALTELLNVSGLKAAAWTQLRWFLMLQSEDRWPVPGEFVDGIRPGPLRASYLNWWLKHDLPGRWLDKPIRVQFGLTLFLHDRPGDALRALSKRMRARLTSRNDPLIRTYG